MRRRGPAAPTVLDSRVRRRRGQCGLACGSTVLTSAVATIGRKRTNRQNSVKKRPKLPSRHEMSQIVGVK